MPSQSFQTVVFHAAAPPKPAAGSACNGCGVCCAIERCPVAHVFLARAERCPALEWDDAQARYRCGMVARPASHVRWLPRRWEARAGRWFAARIAAGSGCDCDASEID